MANIVLNTFGSFGDVHPYLALAIELQRRGHECIVATAEVYRDKITAEGVGFAPVRPNVGELLNNPDLIAKLWHPQRGTAYLLRDYLLPRVRESYADLDPICDGADLIITHAAAYAGPLVAAARNLPWLSVALQPAIFFSIREPAVIAAAPWTRHLGTRFFKIMMSFAQRETRRWAKPIFELREQLRIEDHSNPIMNGAFSPIGTLTLFSQAFARQQWDWPQNSLPTGFVFYDKPKGLSESLQAFLRAGPPPVLFTLGSSAVTHPGTFYAESAAAARGSGFRAVLLTGKMPTGLRPNDTIHIEEYTSYADIMPLVSAVVHQGGVGTVAQCLRAGKPMVVVPWAHDQPDNAYRLQGMGIARVLPRRQYNAARIAEHLRTLLNPSSTYVSNAELVAEAIRNEDGLRAACDRIDAVLKN